MQFVFGARARLETELENSFCVLVLFIPDIIEPEVVNRKRQTNCIYA
jgi:hypothetical protein